jgi:hypothetical protein
MEHISFWPVLMLSYWANMYVSETETLLDASKQVGVEVNTK